MGAGLSKKQFNDRVYNRLKKIQRQLIKAGVPTLYKNYQLFPDTTNEKRDLAFNISYTRLNASNGETAGLPTIRLQNGANPIEKFDHLSFDKGIERIIEVFTKLTPDFTVQNEGSIFLLQPLTEAARQWVEEHIPEDAQYFGTAVVVEHRYISDIVQGIQSNGLRVQ